MANPGTINRTSAVETSIQAVVPVSTVSGPAQKAIEGASIKQIEDNNAIFRVNFINSSFCMGRQNLLNKYRFVLLSLINHDGLRRSHGILIWDRRPAGL
jgi:hypothetical protein